MAQLSKTAQEYVDLVAAIGDANTCPGGLQAMRRLLAALPPLPEKAEILDIGCNTGSTTIALAERFPSARVTGIDIHEGMISKAAEVLRLLPHKVNVVYKVADAMSLPYRNGSFDLIFSGGSLAFISDPVAAIREAARALKPGGSLAAIEYFYPKKPPTAEARAVERTTGIPAVKFTADFWPLSFDQPELWFEGVDISIPEVYGAAKSRAMVSRVEARLKPKYAPSVVKKMTAAFAKALKVFAQNNRYLLIGSYLSRRNGGFAVFSGGGSGMESGGSSAN